MCLIVLFMVVLSCWFGFVVFLFVVEVIFWFFIWFFIKVFVLFIKYIVCIGVGNFFWCFYYWYLIFLFGMWMYYLLNGYVCFDLIIVDIGSGSGCFFVGFCDCEYYGIGFIGYYFGFDVDKDMVVWCLKNFFLDCFMFKVVEL